MTCKNKFDLHQVRVKEGKQSVTELGCSTNALLKYCLYVVLFLCHVLTGNILVVICYVLVVRGRHTRNKSAVRHSESWLCSWSHWAPQPASWGRWKDYAGVVDGPHWCTPVKLWIWKIWLIKTFLGWKSFEQDDKSGHLLRMCPPQWRLLCFLARLGALWWSPKICCPLVW